MGVRWNRYETAPFNIGRDSLRLGHICVGSASDVEFSTNTAGIRIGAVGDNWPWLVPNEVYRSRDLKDTWSLGPVAL